MSKKYEYAYARWQGHDVTQLNAFGAEGWLLIHLSAIYPDANTEFQEGIFSREVADAH